MTGDDLLFEACRTGQLKVVNELVERILVFKLKPKANVNAKDADGYSPLFYAVRDGHRDIVRTLLAKGADVNAKDRAGATPLFHAVRSAHKDIVNLLLAKGADVNVRDMQGRSALDDAAQAGYEEIVRRLIAKGAENMAGHGKTVMALPARAMAIGSVKSTVPAEGGKTVGQKDKRLANDAKIRRVAPAVDVSSEKKSGALAGGVDERLARIGDINDFIYDERDRLLSEGRSRDDSLEIIGELLKKYKLYRGTVVCDHIEKCRAILMYATGEGGGLHDMVGEIGWVPDGAALIMGGDLRGKSDQWFRLVELVSKRQKELGVVEASFFDMEGETSIIIEKNPQRRLSNIGKALGGRAR